MQGLITGIAIGVLAIAAASMPVKAVAALQFQLGDFNGDSFVDAEDVNPLLQSLNEGAPYTRYLADFRSYFLASYLQAPTPEQFELQIADIDRNGVFTPDDVRAFGSELGVPIYIPEPTCLIWAVLGTGALARRRR